MAPTILILSGGGPAPTTALPSAGYVIAADSGLGLASDLDLDVDLVVGDLDSADPADVEAAAGAGAAVERHPVDKDATDLELGFQAAMARRPRRIVVAGGGAGRLDHLLGVALLIGDERWATIDVEWHAGSSVAYPVRGERRFECERGELVSLVPLSDTTTISIVGTRWTLDRAELRRGTGRGISNEALGGPVTVTVHRGAAMTITTREEP